MGSEVRVCSETKALPLAPLWPRRSIASGGGLGGEDGRDGGLGAAAGPALQLQFRRENQHFHGKDEASGNGRAPLSGVRLSSS